MSSTIVNGDGSVKTTEITKVDAAPAANTNPDPVLPSEKTEPIKRPEKFKSDEEVYKAYQELEREKGRLAKELGDLRAGKKAPAAETKSEDKGTELTIAPADALASKGLDIAEFQAEHDKNGRLSDESYARLQAAGFNKEQVDAHIAEKLDGEKAKAELYKLEVLKLAGVKPESIDGMREWAGQNLSPEEIALYSEATNSGNAKMAALMLKQVHQKYAQAVGSEGSMIHGTDRAGGIQGYESEAQMLKDMMHPDYKTDPAFRKKVEQKIARARYTK